MKKKAGAVIPRKGKTGHPADSKLAAKEGIKSPGPWILCGTPPPQSRPNAKFADKVKGGQACTIS